MKICVTRSNKFSPSETFLRNQVKGLKQYAEVFQLYGGFLPEFQENGQLVNNRLYWLINKIYKNILKRENNYFGNYGIIKFLKQNQIDIVLANYGVAGVKLLPICQRLHLPLVVHFHGFDASHEPTLKKYSSSYKELFQYAVAIIAVSSDMANSLIRMGASPEKVILNVYGVDSNFFVPGNYEKTGENFISVARFAPKKAPQITIRAFHKVLQLLPNATLTMVGPKDELFEDCFQLVNQLEIADKVTFTGTLSPKDVVPFLQKSDVFLQHSVVAFDGDSEGTPNSILEASSCGLPIISTFHGGIKDTVIHNETGFLVEEGDWEGMVKYMIKLIENPELAKQMGEKGRIYIEKNYSLKGQIDKLFNILQEATQKC